MSDFTPSGKSGKIRVTTTVEIEILDSGTQKPTVTPHNAQRMAAAPPQRMSDIPAMEITVNSVVGTAGSEGPDAIGDAVRKYLQDTTNSAAIARVSGIQLARYVEDAPDNVVRDFVTNVGLELKKQVADAGFDDTQLNTSGLDKDTSFSDIQFLLLDAFS